MTTENKNLHRAGEDYLEAILILKNRLSVVRSIDVADYMGFSKASVSYAVSALQSGGFLTRESGGELCLTDIGEKVAEKIYARHCFFMEKLVAAGVDPETANLEACRMEHAISTDSFEKLKKHGGDSL